MRQARIAGIDFAFAMVLPLMIYYGAFLEIGQNRETFLREQFHLIYDGMVAVFLFLIGFTSGIAASSYRGVKRMQSYLLKRGIIFLFIGLGMSFFWPTNLFTLCGVASLALILVLPLHSTIIFFFAAIIGLSALYSYIFTEIATNLIPWRHGIRGSAMHFLRDGYYAIFPWLIFPLLGTLYSRTDFLSRRLRSLNLVIAGLLIVIAFVLEFFFERSIGTGVIGQLHPFTKITFMHLLLPTFYIGAAGLSVLILNLALQLTEKYQDNKLIVLLRGLGRVKYTILFFQAVAGILLGLHLSGLQTYGSHTIIGFALFYTAGSTAFSFLWMKRFDAGPVEMVLNAIINHK